MTSHGFEYGGSTILSHPIFVETILPFVLIFTIVFAILQKSKVLGDGKRQIDAIVSLVIALLVISFAQATGLIIQLTPFLAVSLMVLLVFMLLIGSFMGEKMPNPIKYILLVVVSIAVIIAVLVLTNVWQLLADIINIGGDSPIFVNALFVIIIVAVVVAVILGGKKATSN